MHGQLSPHLNKISVLETIEEEEEVKEDVLDGSAHTCMLDARKDIIVLQSVVSCHVPCILYDSSHCIGRCMNRTEKRKLHNEELHDLYCSQNVWVIK